MKLFSQSGFSHLLLILAVGVIVVIVIFIATQGFKKILPTPTPSNESTFNIKTDYQNPFRQTQKQYVNPFRDLK